MTSRTAAVVGSDSLLGREIQQVLSEQAPDIAVKLLGDEIETAILTERGGEPVVVSALDETSISSASVVFITGSQESCARTLEIAGRGPDRPALIDLTCSLEEQPDSDLRAPLVDPPQTQPLAPGVHQIAHPASIVLAEFFSHLHRTLPIRRSLVHVFEPASEQGKEGIEELQKQSVNLLTFKSLPQEIYGMQVSFALAPYLGSDARLSLESLETRIVRHLGTLLSRFGDVPVPSLRLVQAPVFHGHSFSIWTEMENEVDPKTLVKALASDRIEVRSAGEEPPTNVGVAGQSGMTVGRIEPDRNNPHAAWFWVVADNHRVAAENAVCLARLLFPVEGSA